jgi:vancomycin aglycone glucosyltransferase
VRVLLSTIGSRGDVQPLVALGLRLTTLGHAVRLCVPPDFQEWIEGLGLPVTPIGPEVRRFAAGTATTPPAPPSPEARRQMIEGTVAAQFETVGAAARDCDLIVGATALQVAAPSIAESVGIPYVFTAYCPTVLPSPSHPPIPLGSHPPAAAADNLELWAQDARRWNDTWSASINSHRASMRLAPVDDVRRYVLTRNPWLAADPTIGPWPDAGDDSVFQTGAWILPDRRPLAPEVERFLDAGDPPVFFGFGSSRAPEGFGRLVVQAARAVGRRAIVSRGWAGLAPAEHDAECLAIGDANLLTLFARVAAVVHHGGAGTTALAGVCGAPQVLVPRLYDQHYWARRVAELGVGVNHGGTDPTVGSLADSLTRALEPGTTARARDLAGRIRRDGVEVAAARLTRGPGGASADVDRTSR